MLLAGIAAGVINAVVGSGSLITFPVLMAVGYPPLVANLSNSVGLVPGNFTGAYGYRHELGGQGPRILRLGVVSLAGAIVGAVLLLKLPPGAFTAVVPWLILLAGAAGTAGFLHFAETVAALETPRAPKADAIVVLTGGYQRIDRAIDLLKNGAGERLLICSDGLWNYLPDADDIARFCAGAEPAAAARALTDHALQAGGQDNITVAIIPIGGAS